MKTTFYLFLISVAGLLFLSSVNSAEQQTIVESTGLIEPAAPLVDSLDTNSNSTEPVTPSAKTVPDNSQAEIPATDMTGFSRGTVARSIFTTLIDNREPVDKVKQVPEKTKDVFYFTELRDMTGQTAKHRWEFKGKVIAEVKFNVRGPRWRVWSKKSFTPGWSGDWKVSVLNGADEVISEEVIAFNEPPKAVMEIEDARSAGTSESASKETASHDNVNNETLNQSRTVTAPDTP